MSVRSTTNPHIQHYEYEETQNVHLELVAESIEANGLDMFYVPRRLVDLDEIYYEDTQSKFDTAYQIPIYVKSSENFMGSEGIMSQFGIEVRLQLILTVARLHFDFNVGQHESDIFRPREGDLIHIPTFNNRTFEIKYVDFHPNFYQHGHLPMYDLTVEMWEYGNEIIDTGIASLDCLADKTSINAYDWSYLTEDGLSILTEEGDILTVESFRTSQEDAGLFDTNDEFDTEANTVIDWSEKNPWGENLVNEPW